MRRPLEEPVIRRATPDDAAVLARFVRAALHASSPGLDDARAFLGRTNAGAYIASVGGEDVACLSFVRDDDVIRIFNPSDSTDAALAALVRAVEAAAAAEGAAATFAQAIRGDQLERVLLGLGYELEYEEADVFAGERVTFVDLVKPL